MTKKIHLFLSAAVLALLALAANPAQAQMMKKAATKTVEVKGTTAARSRGANPNIKSDMSNVDKPQAASRGDYCGIYFDNYTGLTIKIYVDGDYKGTASPWGDATVVVDGGYTRIYCVSAGGTREWNAAGDCTDVYRYTLR